MVDELLSRVDDTKNLAPHFLGGLHLACNLVRPIMWNMAIGTMRPHARPVGIVNGCLQLLEYVVSHFMARDAEGLGIGEFKCRVESAPEDDSRNEASKN